MAFRLISARTSRLMGAPFVLLGLAAVLYLFTGRHASKEVGDLWEHFRSEGYVVRVAPPVETIDFGYAEILGEIFTAEVDGIYVELRRLRDVPQAMSRYRAELSGSSPAAPVADLLSTIEPARGLFRNENFLLSIGSSDGQRVREIGEQFEAWD